MPKARFRSPAQRAHARPIWVVGDESRVPGETQVTILVAQDEPFDELLGHRIGDGFFDCSRFAGFALAGQIDRLPDRRKVAGEWRGRRSLSGFFDWGRRLVPRHRDMLALLLVGGVALMADLGRHICLAGMLNLLVAGARYRIVRKRDQHSQAEKTGERPKASVHSVILREPGGTTHEIERSVWLELHEGYHTTSSQLSRFGNSARKNAEPLGTKTIARKPVRTGMYHRSITPCAKRRKTCRAPRSRPPTTRPPTACA